MNWEFFGVIATLTSAAVVLSITWAVTARIRAGTKRRLLETPPPPPADVSEDVLSALSGLEERLSRIEARQDFTEKLLEAPREPAQDRR